MPSPSTSFYSVADQVIAATICAFVVSALAVLFATSGLTPTFAVALLAAAAAASLQRATEYRRGKRTIADLAAIDRGYWQWSISAIAFGLLLPALFPDRAYSTARWLLSINGLLLLLGIAAIPALKINGRLVAMAAARRSQRTH